MKISSVDLEMRSYLQRIATGPELSKDPLKKKLIMR